MKSLRNLLRKMMNDADAFLVGKLIRKETGCGIMDGLAAFKKLLDALKVRPTILDNPAKLKITWETE